MSRLIYAWVDRNGNVNRNTGLSVIDQHEANLIIEYDASDRLMVTKNRLGSEEGPVSEDSAENIIRKHRK